MALSWRTGAIGASILLNVFLISVVSGVALSRVTHDGPRGESAPERRGGPDHVRGLTPSAYVRALEPGERRAAAGQLRAAVPQSRALMQTIRAARLDVREALNAEPFDGDALLAALERSRQAEAELRARGDALLVDLMSSTDPDARAAALARVQQRARGQRDHDGRWRRWEDERRGDPHAAQERLDRQGGLDAVVDEER